MIEGILIGAYAAGLVAVFVQGRSHRAALRDERARADAAETRSAEQLDAMLGRLATAPRIEMAPVAVPAAVDPAERTFISDLPTDDEAWNDYLGEEPDEDLD